MVDTTLTVPTRSVATIEAGLVTGIILVPADARLNGDDLVWKGDDGEDIVFAPPPEISYVFAPEGCAIGWAVIKGKPVPPAPLPLSLDQRRVMARAECARRIQARASAATQANLTAYATVLSIKPEASRTPAEAADLQAYTQAIDWVAAMRARWLEIAEGKANPQDDKEWPEPSPAAVAMAARF